MPFSGVLGELKGSGTQADSSTGARRDQPGQAGASASQVPRTGAHSGEQITFTKEEATNLVTTALQGARSGREALGIICVRHQLVFQADKLVSVIQKLEAVGPDYNKATTGKRKHGLGTQAMWKFAALAEEVMVAVPLVSEDGQFKKLKDFNEGIQAPTDIVKAAAAVEHFKFKVSKDEKTAYMEAAFKQGSAAEVWPLILTLLERLCELNEQQGHAPQTFHEKGTQKLLDRIQGRRSRK